MPALAVIIPTLNEARQLDGLLSDLHELTIPCEIVVSDGGSTDETVHVARAAGARVLHARRGRARQLHAGAQATTAEWLCFLHADVRLPGAARRAIEDTLRTGVPTAAVWRFAIDAAGTWFRLLELGARLRDRLGGLPYGDQGLLLHRDQYDAAGGFPDIPIMEDVAFLRILRRQTKLTRFSAPVRVSPRRWLREGPYFTWVRNVALITGYLAGVSPERLARWYPPEPH